MEGSMGRGLWFVLFSFCFGFKPEISFRRSLSRPTDAVGGCCPCGRSSGSDWSIVPPLWCLRSDFSEMAGPILTVQCFAVIPFRVFVNVICINHSSDWRATEAPSSSNPETFSSFHWLCSTLHNCWLLGCLQNTKIINNPDHQLITTCFQKRFRHCVIICKHLSVFADNQGQKLTLWRTRKCDPFLKKSDSQAYFYQPMCMPSEVHGDLEPFYNS